MAVSVSVHGSVLGVSSTCAPARADERVEGRRPPEVAPPFGVHVEADSPRCNEHRYFPDLPSVYDCFDRDRASKHIETCDWEPWTGIASAATWSAAAVDPDERLDEAAWARTTYAVRRCYEVAGVSDKAGVGVRLSRPESDRAFAWAFARDPAADDAGLLCCVRGAMLFMGPQVPLGRTVRDEG